MKSNHERPLWKTIINEFFNTLLKTIGLSIFLILFLTPFQSSFDTPETILPVAIALGLAIVLFNDYLRPYLQNKFKSRVLEVVSNDMSDSITPPLKKSRKPISSTSSLPNTPINFPVVKPIDMSTLKNLPVESNHRMDRLRQYRLRCRYLTSTMIIILVMINSVPNSSSKTWIELIFNPMVIVNLLILLEYNISLLAGKPVGGVFFRDNSKPLENPSIGLKGEEKINWLMRGNPLGIGTAIFGRPMLGIFSCCYLLGELGSWEFFACCLVLISFLMYRFRKELEATDGPFVLLRLRVFDSPSYDRFLELLEGWRYIGVQYRLDGPDTTGYNMSTTGFLKILTNKASDLVIKNKVELDAAFAQVSKEPNKFEQFSINGMQCNDAVWVKGLRRAIDQCDAVAMLLTDFSAEHKGCTVELKILMDTVSLSKVVLLVNSDTDLEYLSSILNDAWLNRAEDSPNYEMKEGPYVVDINEMYDYKSENDRKGVTTKMPLIDYIYSKIKFEPINSKGEHISD